MTYIQNTEGRLLARVPRWMRPFVVPSTRNLEFSHPFMRAFWRAWFWPAEKIYDYNYALCRNLVPDRIDYNGRPGIMIRPILGYIFVADEGALWRIAWWKHLTKV